MLGPNPVKLLSSQPTSLPKLINDGKILLEDTCIKGESGREVQDYSRILEQIHNAV